MVAKERIAKALSTQFNRQVSLRPKRTGIFQIYAPLYHDDGDMIDVFAEPIDDARVRICDYGATLMRLSYGFELDTENKKRLFTSLIDRNQLSFDENEGNIFIETTEDELCASVLQFAQTVAKVLTLDVLKRETISGLFLEQIENFVWSHLLQYKPAKDFVPLEGREELEVPYAFMLDSASPVFLHPVKTGSQAKNAAITFLECQKANKKFTGVVVHENLDALTNKERRIITSAADKQFYDLADFREKAESFLHRLAV